MPLRRTRSLEVQSHGPGEDPALDIAPLDRQILGPVGMVHPFDVLFDDRAFIEVRGHRVRRRADELQPRGGAGGIGPGAFETRQETVGMFMQRPNRARPSR